MTLPIDPDHERDHGHAHVPNVQGFGLVIGPEGVEGAMTMVGCDTCDRLETLAEIRRLLRAIGINDTSRSQPMTMAEQQAEIDSLPVGGTMSSSQPMPARPDDQVVGDFTVGEVVQHLFFGRYATVKKVGRKYLWVLLHTTGPQEIHYKWLPTSVRKVER